MKHKNTCNKVRGETFPELFLAKVFAVSKIITTFAQLFERATLHILNRRYLKKQTISSNHTILL